MQDIMNSIFEKLWKKWISVPILILIATFTLFMYVPDTWEVNNTKTVAFYVMAAVFFIFIVTYSIICIKENRLPRAKSLSVLFIVDTETDSLYNDVKNKLVTNFNDCFWNDDINRFSSVCVRLSDLSKFNLNDKADQISILKKTNCALFVKVRYHVDDTTNAENFETDINYAIVHPTLQKQAQDMLQREMSALAIPIKKRRFQKDKTLETLDFTAQALSIICQYVYALVLLLTGRNENAYQILHKLREDSQHGREATKKYDISILINMRLYQACMGMVESFYDEFYNTNKIEALESLNCYLEEANTIYSNTYDYHLGKAYYLVAHDLDGEKARSHIYECKKLKDNENWKYSDAFLSAYFHNSASTIAKKYASAFKVPHDLSRIADYIEYILNKTNDHEDLHFAAGLVYDELGNNVLAEEQYLQYLKTNNGRKASSIVNAKIKECKAT